MQASGHQTEETTDLFDVSAASLILFTCQEMQLLRQDLASVKQAQVLFHILLPLMLMDRTSRPACMPCLRRPSRTAYVPY